MSLKAASDVPQRGHFRFRTKGRREKTFHLDPITQRKKSARRKSLSKNRIYLNTPQDWYMYHPEDPRDVTSSYQRQGTLYHPHTIPHEPRTSGERKIVFERMFPSPNRRSNVRKGMIIGERAPLWKLSEARSPELPDNLFVDNLRHQSVDWKKYNNVTWSDILGSHMKDVDRTRIYAQTLPQKEAWLASIDSRVRYSKMKPDRGLPHISPRLFNNKLQPQKLPQITKYVSKDKQGNIYYIVGPSDVTKKEYRSFLLPEIVKPVVDAPNKLDF